MSEGKAAALGRPEELFSGAALKEVYGMDVRAFMLESLEKWKT
jgi:iron complex transport system ATP-binding protein